jgi:hypothetical protein
MPQTNEALSSISQSGGDGVAGDVAGGDAADEDMLVCDGIGGESASAGDVAGGSLTSADVMVGDAVVNAVGDAAVVTDAVSAIAGAASVTLPGITSDLGVERSPPAVRCCWAWR